MKHYFIAAILACASSLAVQAQDRMTPDLCAQSLNAVERLLGVQTTVNDVAIDNEGWCQLETFNVSLSLNHTIRMKNVRWRASGLDRLIEQGLPPRTLDVIADGVAVVTQTGDPILDYLLSLETALVETGFGLSVRWDGVQNAILVDDAYYDFSRGSRIEATARIEGVDLTDGASIATSLGSMGLSELTINSDFAGWFEAFAGLGLVRLLDSDGAEPQAQVTALIDQAVQSLDQVPETILPQPSRSALGAFISTLPHPRGTLRLQLNANPPIGVTRMVPFAALSELPSMQQIVELGLDGVALLFIWTPTGE